MKDLALFVATHGREVRVLEFLHFPRPFRWFGRSALWITPASECGERDRHGVGKGEEVPPHPRLAVPPLPGGEGEWFYARMRAARYSQPSPRGEGGPRQAFSPAVAGRMRGSFRALDDQLPATHNSG